MLSPATLVSGNLYYDEVRYNPIFSSISDKDRDGFGAGVKIDQLLSDRFKLLGEANAREIYNTYQAGVSWLPLAKKTGMGLELSLLGQHITSHNTTPNNNSISLQINFLADGTKNYGSQLATAKESLNTIAQWVEAPAVKMNQVLVIAEQITRLLGPGISSINPNSGSFAGGTIITISGSNFIQGLLVLFGDTVATNIQVLSPTLIQVTVPASPTPPSSTPESVTVVIQNPDGQQTSQPNGYTYIDENVNPVITTIQPAQGPAAGGQLITITGSNLAGTTGVTFDNNTVVPTSVSPTQITVITPAHAAGSVDVTVSTAQGNTTIANGYTYLLPAPTVFGISDDGVIVFGTGSTGTTAKVVDAAGSPLGEAQVASDGSFTITLSPPQTNGQTLTVTVEDADGTSSEPTIITAPDITDPDAPTNVVISNNGMVITGQGEAGTTVTVTNSAGGEIVRGTVDSNGDFSLSLDPPQTNGQILMLL